MVHRPFRDVRKVELIRRFPPRVFPWRTVSIGCGPRLYSDLHPDYVCLDIDASAKPDVVADAHMLPFRDNAFDGVELFDILEHSTFYGAILSEARRVSKPGARVWVSTVWRQGVAVELDPQHVHCFSETLIRRVMDRHGFAVDFLWQNVDVMFLACTNTKTL